MFIQPGLHILILGKFPSTNDQRVLVTMLIDTSGIKEDGGFEGKKQSTEAIIEWIIGFDTPQTP